MIHLFSKCYLELDNKIDINTDRYVISKENGSDVWEKIKDIQRGTLYGYQYSIDSSAISSTLSSIYFTLKNKDDKIVYYVDEESFPKFLAGWYKFLLPNLDESEASNLYKAIVLYHNVYHRFVFQEQSSVEELILSSDPSVFLEEFKSLKDVQYTDHEKYFRELILPSASFEFKIASFLKDGSMSKELSDITQVLLTKEVENALIEVREVFYSLFLRPEFSTKIGLNKTYNLSNAFDVYKDGSKYTELLFNNRIWKTTALSLASSSSSTVSVADLTEADGQEFRDFINDIGLLTSYDSDSIIQDGLYLTEYLSNIKGGFTSEEMKDFIVHEYKKVNSASIFNSTALPSVNSYLLDHILKNMENAEVLKKYSLV
jgi:hypothetical protein